MPSRKLQEDSSSPTSFAIKSMNDLRNWSPSTDSFNVANIKLQPREINRDSRPRLILTHDMAGGYKEDKYIQGNDYQNIYYCQYWHLVDMFIYFSHERVSIPPVNWTNACHRNGVQCLGTFLVEGGNQMHELEALLHGPPFHNNNNDDDDDPMRLWSPFYADKLVAIAKHYGFDGWLINIECQFSPFPTSPYFKASELSKFIGYLTEKMHQEIPNSKVIWYDSMITTGEIDWQNQLNEKNDMFFKNSDGIFLNYWWKENYPEQARQTAELLGRSNMDVYFGTDVWGRGTFGGGGFKSYKGIKAASDAFASSALFAMAWTYEFFEKTDFEKMDRLFWCGGDFSEYPPLPPSNVKDTKDREKSFTDSDDEMTHGHKKGITNVLKTYPVPNRIWFVTNFDRGFGSGYYYRGKQLFSQSWSHLSHQSILPNLDYRNPIPYPSSKHIDMKCFFTSDYGAFSGGTSLLITGQRSTHRETDLQLDVNVPLFELHTNVSRGCCMKYVYKPFIGTDVSLIMTCDFKLYVPNNDIVTEFLSNWLPDSTIDIEKEDGFRITVMIQDDISESRCFYLPATGEETKGDVDWITKAVDIPPVHEACQLVLTKIEFNIIVNTANLAGVKPHPILSLGYLSIIPNIAPPTLQSCIIGNDVHYTDQIHHLEWQDVKIKQLDENQHQFFGTLHWIESINEEYEWKHTEYYMISHQMNEECMFIGTAFCTQYRISGLNYSKNKVNKIIVESVNREGIISSIAMIDMIC